jgi:hypothetical protein
LTISQLFSHSTASVPLTRQEAKILQSNKISKEGTSMVNITERLTHLIRNHRAIWRFLLSFALFLIWSDSAFCEQQRYAVVLDVKGEVILISEFDGFEDEAPLMRTNYLSMGNKIQLANDSQVVLLRLADYQQITYTGPDEILIQSGLSQIGGTKRESNPFAINGSTGGALLAVLGGQQSSTRMPQAVIGIRDLGKGSGSITLFSPVDWEKVIDSHPVFSWNNVKNAGPYRFILKEKAGASILDKEVRENSLTLPKSIRLKDGTAYTWMVTSRAGNEILQSMEWSFQVVTAADRASLRRILPKKDAKISNHVLYAMVLEKMGVISAAKKQWRVLNKLRPKDPLFKRKSK